MTTNIVGFELLLKCLKHDIKKKEDILLLLVHHSLLRAGFKCAGIGEEWNESNDTLSELLPDSWNASKEYILRYKRGDEKFILMTNRADDVIVFNFTSPEKMKVTNVIFNIDESVRAIDGQISSMITKPEDIVRTVSESLITPFTETKKVNMETQTVENPRPNVSVIEDINRYPRVIPDIRDLRNINDIGRRDLDPLAAMGIGGGGMLFDPRGAMRNPLRNQIGVPEPLPRGSVPPGARFDPFGPPDTDFARRLPPDYFG